MQRDTSFQRVLICENQGITVMALRKALIRAGYVVVAEETEGEKAVALTRQLRPDLVIMDSQLSGSLSGLEAAREILQEQTMPILILTTYSDEGHQAEALAAGVCGYLVKPLTSEQLLPAVEEALERFHTLREAVQAIVSSNETASAYEASSRLR